MSKFTKKDLEEKFGKPCIEIIPNAAPGNPGAMPEETVNQITECLENTSNQIQNYTPFVPDSTWRHRTGITLRNQQYLFDAIEYAQEHPDTRPPNFDMEMWINSIGNYNIFILIYRLIMSVERLCWRAFRIFAVRAWDMFGVYYRYVRNQGKEGDEDAQTIYERLTTYYDFRRGSRTTSVDSHDELAEDIEVIEQLVQDSNKKVKKYLEKEKELQKILKKDINSQDEILDKE